MNVSARRQELIARRRNMGQRHHDALRVEGAIRELTDIELADEIYRTNEHHFQSLGDAATRAVETARRNREATVRSNRLIALLSALWLVTAIVAVVSIAAGWV